MGLKAARGFDPANAGITGGTAALSTLTMALGTAAAPSIVPTGGDGNDGFFWVTTTTLGYSVNGVEQYRFGSSGFFENTLGYGTGATAGNSDTVMVRVGANQWRYGPSAGSTVTARSEINKAVTAISDGVAKSALTITIPNAAHSASILVRVTGSMGAGGAIGANEASATNAYIVTVARTAGVNAVATISSAFGAAAANVAGADSVTATAALAAVSGAVGAANTIDITVTVTKSGGSSDNHTAVVHASLLNANATGVSLS